MPDIRPERTERVDSLLRRNGYQQYRIAILLRCGAVRLLRDRSSTTLNQPDAHVRPGDLVRVSDPLPDTYQRALNQIPIADFRDYAFAPGTTPFDLAIAGVLDARPQTIRLNDPLIDTLFSFLRALKSSPAITNPIRHIVIAGHANPEGLLLIRMETGHDPSGITYEDLDAAQRAKSLHVAPELLNPRPKDSAGQPIPAALYIKGCRIGSTLPYLEKLKAALGGALLVNAPKHFHIAAQHVRPDGRVEYMLYGFSIYRPRKFRDRAEAIREFGAREFRRIDGSPVPARRWQEWIPRGTPNQQHNFRSQVISPINNTRLTVPVYLRYRERKLFDGQQSIGLPADPRTEAGRKRAVRDALVRAHERYRDTHPFPEYVRFGYASMEAFMNGWTWSFSWRASDNTLLFQATRYEYTVMQPIVDPATNRLFLNFYPTGRAGKLMVMLREDDTRFFATV